MFKASIKTAALLALTGAAFAGQYDKPFSYDDKPADKAASTGFGVGMAYLHGDGFALRLSYDQPCYEVGLTASAAQNRAVPADTDNWFETRLGLYAGMKKSLMSDLAVSYGVVGSMTFADKDKYNDGRGYDHRPYLAGAYAGLVKSFGALDFTATVLPVSYSTDGYESDSTRVGDHAASNKVGFFNNGSIGMTYHIG